MTTGPGLGDLFAPFGVPPQPASPEPKPLPTIRAKEINGVLYLNAEDVALALESQNSAPRIVTRIRARASRVSSSS